MTDTLLQRPGRNASGATLVLRAEFVRAITKPFREADIGSVDLRGGPVE